MIHNFNNFLKINENSDYELMKVLTFNREDSLEFEDLLHKNGYTWVDGQKYLIEKFESVNKVVFKKISNKDKSFQGMDISWKSNDEKIREEYINDEEYDLEYPKDRLKILKKIINSNRWLYKPKIILK